MIVNVGVSVLSTCATRVGAIVKVAVGVALGVMEGVRVTVMLGVALGVRVGARVGVAWGTERLHDASKKPSIRRNRR